MKNIVIIAGLTSVALLLFGGCEQQGLVMFGENYSAVNFLSDSTSYSFLKNPEDEYIQEIPVHIMGEPADTDRNFTVEVVEDSLTTAEPSDYEILGGTIPAGEYNGTLRIKLFSSPKIDEQNISLHVRIVTGDTFQPGTSDASDFFIVWTNQVIVPEYWNLYGLFFCQRSTSAYRLIVEQTGLDRLTFDEFGEYGFLGLTILGTQFGDYVKQYNLDHPDDILRHDDGPLAGQPIEPRYFTQSKYD